MAATRAAWLSAWEAEAASSGRCTYAQSLLDLVKAFEMVPHARLWDAAKKRGFPLAILRLALEAYKMPRSLGIVAPIPVWCWLRAASLQGLALRPRNSDASSLTSWMP